MHSVWHASLRTYQFVGGNEVFKQYFQTNQASGNGPGPAALGAHGLADAWTYTKADDDYEVTYWLYGDSEYSTHHKGNDPPATGCPVHKRSSQAKAYVTLYDNDFFAGKELTRLIRRGGDSKKGTVAKVMICPPANADAATGQAEAWPAIAIAKGAKVMQSAGAGVPITGKLWRAVQLNDREIWELHQSLSAVALRSDARHANLRSWNLSRSLRCTHSHRRQRPSAAPIEPAPFAVPARVQRHASLARNEQGLAPCSEPGAAPDPSSEKPSAG